MIQDTIFKLNNIKLRSFHGCLEEEKLIGANYIINVTMYFDFKKACDSDKLEDTINYAQVIEIIKKEMNKSSDLIENAAKRASDAILQSFQKIRKLEFSLQKIAPPVPFEIYSAEVILVFENK